MSCKAVNKLERLIDDNEIERYLHNEKEKHYKKIIWEALNKEYLQQQANKEADVAAKKAFEANFCGRPEELQAAWKLAAKANVTKSKKRQTKKDAEAGNLDPAQISSDATHQMATKKRRSSKINYDALEKLSGENVVDNLKKPRVESPTHGNEFDESDDKYENEDQLVDDDEGAEDEYGDYTYEEEGEGGGGYYYDDSYDEY